jgi:hypothetical protein
MGMFDYLRSSYQLPEPFMGLNQTKGIEGGIGGSLSNYWIDPRGYLWVGFYGDTHTLEFIEENDPRFSEKYQFLNHEWVRTGKHGKWRVHPITKYIEIYPSQWDGKWEDWPRLRLHFRSGKLREWVEVTGR